MDEPEASAREVPPWSIGRVVGYSLLVGVAFLATQTVVVVAAFALQLIEDRDLKPEEWAERVGSDGLTLSLATLAVLLVCVPLVGFLVGRREADPWVFLGLRPVATRTIWTWIGALAAFVVVSDSITIAIGRPVVPEFMAEAYSSAPPTLLFVALVFAAPVFEELFFRGFVPGALEASGVSAVAAAVVSSLAWSVIHMQYDWYGVVTIFLMGLLFAAARSKTRSLVPCVAMHAVANTIAFTEAVVSAGPAPS